MADADWKKLVEFEIDSSSDDDGDDNECVELRKKSITSMVEKTASLDISNGYRREMTTEELINKFDMDEYGSTPPRTRIKNKTRDWDRKQKLEAATKAIRGINRMSKRVNRRNTLDCALLNEMFIDDDSKKCDKRSMQLLRESERDMKLASGIIYPISGSPTPINASPSKTTNTNYGIKNVISSNKAASIAYDECCDNFTAGRTAAPKLIETGSRFMSVQSRPIGCRSSAPAQSFPQIDTTGPTITTAAALNQRMRSIPQPNKLASSGTSLSEKSMLQTRQEFHETFANLIKLGSSDKQDAKLSNEDYIWQTELKDMIWLELQARHAGRTLEQQDKYLYSARQGIPDLLNKILNYRFVRRFEREMSVCSTDSGVSVNSPHISTPSTPESSFTADTNNTTNKPSNKSHFLKSKSSTFLTDLNAISTSQGCNQCYSMYCKDCQEQQTLALREVEELLTRLEAAEALFPSTKILANVHPVYKSPEFVGRVKAMCLWYNITRHHRLKLLIVGKIFARLQGKTFHWPMSDKHADSSASSSIQENDDSGRDSIDSRKIPPARIPKVKFTCDGDSSTSPSDSVSSVDSMREAQNCPIEVIASQSNLQIDYQDIFRSVDLSIHNHTFNSTNQPLSPYRKYIEHVLKSRGLGQSLSFLHRLHNVVLRKAHATLEVPGAEESDTDFDGFHDELQTTEIPLSKEHEEELHRYGIWSEEAISLNLPSYVPAFVFLSFMPLEVMHEYLRMRLESKPLTPNPLSLEQLMKELREGLILAMTHRERYSKHIHTAFYDKDTELDKHLLVLDNYDATVKNVLDLYLEYVEQWVLVAAPEGHRKNALDKEWMFSKLICPMIPGQHAKVAQKFCQIVSDLLQITGNRLITRSRDLDDQIKEKSDLDEDEKKWEILTVCREIQALLTLEREKTMRLMSFAKSLCRDIEMPDFHRDHDCDGKDFVCQVVKDAVARLQRDVLSVRNKLTTIIERVQERSDVKYLGNMDEVDKLAILSRAREILHQGYKFGFEYHKDIVRLFEMKIVCCKDKSCEYNLSLGIINFAKMWMKFVTERCERGRGVRPRWATLGLEFLIACCDPSNTRHLSDEEFDDLKTKMDACISHVVGIGTEPEKIRKRASPRSRKISPGTPNRGPNRGGRNLSPRITNEQRTFMNSMSVREEVTSPISAPNTPELVRKQTSCDQVDHNNVSASSTLLRVPKLNNFGPALRQVRVRDAVNQVDMELDRKLRDRKLIGQIKTVNSSDKIQIKLRSVNFRWHRGIKIGQGRFGKVYTAVNNSTGELMAMKEIAIQPGETKAIRNVAEELKIFEGISHRHLVKVYGVEIHREELLIFMELCSEGTLESLVEMSNGLHECLTRRYTAQLLDAVTELHKHGVVHRDIKPANIFLTKSGNCLKLGDFGSAVKIQAHTTIPGELQAYVGTQAYMAPEVFTRNHTDGHGRAADIWSVGCVVVEMASGKRPWAQFDSNFQIMFKVGMGESPEIPDTLSEEGQDFLQHCLEHDPRERWLAAELLQHHFCKVDFQDDTSTENDGPKLNTSKSSSNLHT